jgi:hypothetical protein
MSALSLCDCTQPISPFMWDAPSVGKIIPAGCTPGHVADVMAEVDRLSLRFEQIVDEMTGPYSHPAYGAFRSHPLHTKGLTRHQFDVMRYGIILDRTSNLVLVQLPRHCADDGAKANKTYEALFSQPLNTTQASMHPLHEEYSFAVYKFSDNTEDEHGKPHATPLFRLMFRNEAHNCSRDESFMSQETYAKHFPFFRLRGVFISHDDFYSIHDRITNYRKYHSDPKTTAEGAACADVNVLKDLSDPKVQLLCDAWLQVLEGIIPSKVDSRAVVLTAPGSAALSAPVSAMTVTALDPTAKDVVDFRIRCSYYTSEQRMRNRIHIVRKTRALIKHWREGADELQYYGDDVDFGAANPFFLAAPAIRVLFRGTRTGKNYIDQQELCAFLPQESDCERHQVYGSTAAERLRLWVFRALLTAELSGVHYVWLELDPRLIISQCTGLLHGSESNRDREVLFHVCRIFVETVEDFVQHSGNIWKADIVIADADFSEENNAPNVVALCEDILECLFLTKKRLELAEKQLRDGPQPDASPSRINKILEQVAREEAKRQAEGLRSPVISENVIFSASTYRVFVTDDQLYPLFQYLDTNKDGAVRCHELVRLFLCKENKIERENNTKSGAPYQAPLSDAEALRMQASKLSAHPLCPLDGCGLPFDEASMTSFVMSFVRHNTSAKEPQLNYQEFAMMMLSLAKR